MLICAVAPYLLHGMAEDITSPGSGVPLRVWITVILAVGAALLVAPGPGLVVIALALAVFAVEIDGRDAILPPYRNAPIGRPQGGSQPRGHGLHRPFRRWAIGLGGVLDLPPILLPLIVWHRTGVGVPRGAGPCSGQVYSVQESRQAQNADAEKAVRTKLERGMTSSTRHVLDTTRPNVARVYDYLLGGIESYDADRAQAAALLRICPSLAIVALKNRYLIARRARLGGDQGITQLIDLGAGAPVHKARAGVLRTFPRDGPGGQPVSASGVRR